MVCIWGLFEWKGNLVSSVYGMCEKSGGKEKAKDKK